MANSSGNWGTWVWVKWKAGAPEDAINAWKGNQWIKGAWSTAGQWDAIFWVPSSDWSSIKKHVWQDFRSNKWVESTQTTPAEALWWQS